MTNQYLLKLQKRLFYCENKKKITIYYTNMTKATLSPHYKLSIHLCLQLKQIKFN